jgi:hypothetical protein
LNFMSVLVVCEQLAWALSASFVPLQRLPHNLTYSVLNRCEVALNEHGTPLIVRINCFNKRTQLVDRERFTVWKT